MPELPEVETTCRGIRPHVQERSLSRLVVRNPRLRVAVPADLPAHIEGARLEAVDRRAKYLLLRFPAGTVIVHLGMSGSLRVVAAAEPAGRDVSPWLPSRDWTHLDPDFDHLTYGNNENVKATRVAQLKPGDLLAFYASLRAVDQPGTLVYALIGLITVDRIVKADTISDTERHLNAHTRRTPVVASDVVIFGVPELSGRLERAIPIGAYRDRAYRVRVDLLEAWGGLTANDGYIQRSAVPPGFVDSTRFILG